jgi:hypothetical protein
LLLLRANAESVNIIITVFMVNKRSIGSDSCVSWRMGRNWLLLISILYLFCIANVYSDDTADSDFKIIDNGKFYVDKNRYFLPVNQVYIVDIKGKYLTFKIGEVKQRISDPIILDGILFGYSKESALLTWAMYSHALVPISYGTVYLSNGGWFPDNIPPKNIAEHVLFFPELHVDDIRIRFQPDVSQYAWASFNDNCKIGIIDDGAIDLLTRDILDTVVFKEASARRNFCDSK